MRISLIAIASPVFLNWRLSNHYTSYLVFALACCLPLSKAERSIGLRE
jgi:hypothetical protein